MCFRFVRTRPDDACEDGGATEPRQGRHPLAQQDHRGEEGEYGVQGVAVSVLSIIGRNGIEDIHEVMMTDEERDGFLKSVDTIRKEAKSEGIIG